MTLVWRHLTAREVDHEVLWLAVGGALVALAAIIIPLPNIQLPLCGLKVLTGLPCPTCGLTRTVLALSRGDMAAALFFNPLAAIAIGAGAVYLLYAAVVLAFRLPRFRPVIRPAGARLVRITVFGLVAANWAWLIATGR